jgi:outer membrane immunogenic protein
MKRIVLATAMTALLAGTALAADMPARMPTKAVPYVAMYNWTGAYVGLNAGYGWARASDSLGASANLNGFVGGGQIGYNWQANGSPLVLGLEADFQGTGQSQTQTVPGVATLDTRVRWFGTVRGRLGYAADRALFYVTGGLAYVNSGVTLTTAAGQSTDSGTKAGYALGGGIEYAFAGPWTAGLEYLYVDTGSRSVTVGAVNDSIKIRENILRAKINYRF